MSNNLIQIIRKKFRETLANIRPQYNNPSFLEFLSKPVEESKEPLKEGSKIFQQFESIIDEKYREFQRTFQADEKKIIESLVKEPTEYIKNAQLKVDYVEFLLEYSAQFQGVQVREKLENSDQRPPYLWMEFQQKHLGKELIDRLEKIRTDPQFQDYIKAKERWKEDMKSRQPPITGDKAIDNHLKYVEILPQVHRWIMKQLYMDFRHHNQANFFKFLEKDFTDQKQLAREKVQKQQMQRQQGQMPQQSNPFEQAKQPAHYDQMKQQQQQPMSSHQPAYDPMKQQQQLGNQTSPYDSSSMKQNPQQQMHQYGNYDTTRNNMPQSQSSHYGGDTSKMHNQGMQNQYGTQGGQQQQQQTPSQYQQHQQNSQYNQQQPNNSYDNMLNKSQYDSMKQQYPQQQNMYESANKVPQQMNTYDTTKQQQSMSGYDPSKQYQGHQMNQINTHASPQLAHGSHMNQNAAMQQRGVAGPNANRNAKMMGAHLAGSQGQGAHNYQQASNVTPQQMHNPAQISAGQSPRTQPSPSIHQNTHSQQQMLAQQQQQQMHSSQSGHQGHMQHMQSTIPTSASPHQNANSHYSMNSSYNAHQNMSQMHQQGKMGLPSPNPNQSHQSSTNPSGMSHPGMMNQSQTSGHYGSQQSSMQGQSQGRQMSGQNQNPSQMVTGQYPNQMGREKIDSLNARQSLSQQSQYSNSDSLTPRQSLSQNQNQTQGQNMYQQSQNQAAEAQRERERVQAEARAQAEQQARERAERAERAQAEQQARERAQAEAQRERERVQAEARAQAEQQARERAERAQAEAQARAQAQAQAQAQAEARERERVQAEAQARQAEAEARLRAEAQAKAQAQAQAQAHAQAEAQAKEAAMKRAQMQQQQQAQQAALNAQQEQRKFEPLKPKLISKDKFDLAFNFDNLKPFTDFGTGLNEISEKFKHPYGNPRVIEDFERKVREEEHAMDDSIAEIEQQAQAQKKRIKVNPSFEEELNLIPSASTSTSTKESHISSIPAPLPEIKQPILKPVEKELNELKMDHRVKVEERGSLSLSPYIDTIFYRMNDGIISYHEKLVLKIFQDETKGIEIQEMANISDFMSEYNDTIFFALKDAKVKVLVETWLEFIDMCAQKANSKIQDLDDLFG